MVQQRRKRCTVVGQTSWLATLKPIGGSQQRLACLPWSRPEGDILEGLSLGRQSLRRKYGER
jgi:hypothetical protein